MSTAKKELSKPFICKSCQNWTLCFALRQKILFQKRNVSLVKRTIVRGTVSPSHDHRDQLMLVKKWSGNTACECHVSAIQGQIKFGLVVTTNYCALDNTKTYSLFETWNTGSREPANSFTRFKPSNLSAFLISRWTIPWLSCVEFYKSASLIMKMWALAWTIKI